MRLNENFKPKAHRTGMVGFDRRVPQKEHPELAISKCAKNLGFSKSALSTWAKMYEQNNGAVPTRGRGNYESDEAKEIARLKKELRDT